MGPPIMFATRQLEVLRLGGVDMIKSDMSTHLFLFMLDMGLEGAVNKEKSLTWDTWWYSGLSFNNFCGVEVPCPHIASIPPSRLSMLYLPGRGA